MTLEAGVIARDEALDELKQKNAEFVQRARSTAFEILKQKKEAGLPEIVTSDDIWATCPPPPEVNPKVMGTVFSKKLFDPCGFVRTRRAVAHARPITQWTWKTH